MEDEATGVIIPPFEDNPQEPVTMHPHLEGVPDSMPSGMGRGFFDEEEEANQQPLLDTAVDTLDQSVANSAWEYLRTTPQAMEEVLTTGTADLEPMREELTKDIPLHLQDNVMSSLSVSGAKAKRARILEDQETQLRLAQQVGLSSTAVQFAAGILDADLPLMFMSGGTYAAARTANSVAKTTRVLTGSTALSRGVGELATGVTGGALSGAIVGGLGTVVRDDMDVSGMLAMIAGSAALGGVLNPVAGTILPDRNLWTEAARMEYGKVFKEFEADLHRDLMDPDAPINNNTKPIDEVDTTPPPKPFTQEVDDSVGAARVDGDVQREVVEDQLGLKDAGATDNLVETSIKYQNWKQDYRFDELYGEDTANPWVRTLVGGSDYRLRVPYTDIDVPIGKVAGQVFTLAQRDFTNLVHSKAPTANFVAAEILESSSGLVRSGTSSAVLKEMYHGSAMTHSARELTDARAVYMREKGLNPARSESHRQFSRDLRLTMHDYYTTGRLNGFEDLIAALDNTHRDILDRMKGLDEDRSVRGARDIDHQPGYFKYDWEPKHFVNVRKEVGQNNLVKAFKDGYIRGSDLSNEVAETVAKAIVRRFTNKGMGIDNADARMLEIDTKEGVAALLEDSGMSPEKIKQVVASMTADSQERAKKGFLKRRTELDLHTVIPGSNLKLVDLMTDDLERSVQQYVGDAAGAAALAHKGIRDQADLKTLKETILAEQVALGEAGMKPDELDAIFSQFGGGVHKGYMAGVQTRGVNPITAMLTKATRASLLQRVGLTQLMDTANLFVANGVANTMEPVMARLGRDKPGGMSKADYRVLHEELESLGVAVGEDHMLFRPHLSIDELEMSSNTYMQVAQRGMNTVERATNYASGQIHATAAQQIVAASAVSTNVVRTLAGLDTNLSDRMLRDIGLTEQSISSLKGMINDGTIRVDGGKVKLNSAKWDDPDLELEFGASVLRAVHQQAQKGFVGETSVWMNTDIGRILSALKTFSLVAVQKQTARGLMIGGKQHILRMATWQLGFSYAILSASQKMQGTEMSPVDRARLAVAYSASLGVVPMVADPLTSMLGMDDMNFSPYGRYAGYLDTPVFEQAGKLARAPGAIADMVTGDGDYDDMQNAKAMFMLNWYGMKQVWEAM